MACSTPRRAYTDRADIGPGPSRMTWGAGSPSLIFSHWTWAVPSHLRTSASSHRCTAPAAGPCRSGTSGRQGILVVSTSSSSRAHGRTEEGCRSPASGLPRLRKANPSIARRSNTGTTGRGPAAAAMSTSCSTCGTPARRHPTAVASPRWTRCDTSKPSPTTYGSWCDTRRRPEWSRWSRSTTATPPIPAWTTSWLSASAAGRPSHTMVGRPRPRATPCSTSRQIVSWPSAKLRRISSRNSGRSIRSKRSRPRCATRWQEGESPPISPRPRMSMLRCV